ncbi:hypothetical protein Tco_0216223 [Tanacetum coccineum]|uniref:Tubulin-specific chaperone A n=1 Tax=Tanacetum coccineum TaxID=301880 RepID=A0ABQ5HJ72_9ASTR
MATNEETNAAGTDYSVTHVVESGLRVLEDRIHRFPKAVSTNQLPAQETSVQLKTHATVHEVTLLLKPIQGKLQCKEPKERLDSQYFKDKALLMEAKEKGDVLDAEAESILADVECTAPL